MNERWKLYISAKIAIGSLLLAIGFFVSLIIVALGVNLASWQNAEYYRALIGLLWVAVIALVCLSFLTGGVAIARFIYNNINESWFEVYKETDQDE